MNSQRLERLARDWRKYAITRAVRIVYLVSCLAVIPLALHPTYSWVMLPYAAFLAVLIGSWWATEKRRVNAALIARHLDRSHPELEESSGLWLRPAASLTLLERLQLARLERAATRLTESLPARTGLGQPPPYRGSTLLFALAGFVLILAGELGVALHPGHPPASVLTTAKPRPTSAKPPPSSLAWPKITGGGLTITPLPYTGHAPRQVAGFDAEVEEGATVAWRLALDRPVRNGHLVFGPAAADQLPLQPTDGLAFGASRTLAETSLYTLTATLLDGTAWNPPEVWSLKVSKDQPPTLRIVQPAEPRTIIQPLPTQSPSCFVEVLAADDYGVAAAHLVATVAKGSGEAVKFREQAIPFDDDRPGQPAAGFASKSRRFTRTLDLTALGLAPGDELYFYVEASDNRQPTPNRTRSETRFLVLPGPDKPAFSSGRGVAGVNLVPQYFRSERQLIIDTEKLLADRATLSDQEFRSRANDLGADQGLLRLRYGQFLGEDQEDGPATDHAEVNLNPLQATAPTRAPGPRAAASIAQRFLQEHAEQDRVGGSDETRDANLRAAPAAPLSAAQVRQPYVDSHDTQDKATFFDQASKGTMRDALSAMWAAEGSLRVALPQDALAPEHRALDILKDLQQSARAYVQHVGFEPAPLKIDERRLQGDAASVPTRLSETNPVAGTDTAQAAVRAALAAPMDRETLRRVEPALTAAATRQPDEFLAGLQALHRLLATAAVGANGASDDLALQRALLRLLPPAWPLPGRTLNPAAGLEVPYFQALQAGEGRP